MGGNRISKAQRKALRAGRVEVFRGWRRPPAEPERAPSSVRRIDPLTGLQIGVLISVPAARLRLTPKVPWRVQREVKPC